jgi:putative tryptophan/tyrosine transport system substrate-binding protein
MTLTITNRSARLTTCLCRKLICLLIVTVLSCGGRADAQEVKKLGVLSGGSPDSTAASTAAFRQALKELGYTEGQNIRTAYRYANGQLGKLPEFASQLVSKEMDVIVAQAPAAVRAAKSVTSTIPVVMAHGGDPVAQGFVASLARPGGNVTGLSNFSAELSGKRLELLKEAFPKVSRVAVIWNPDAPGPALGFKELEIAAKMVDVPLESLRVRGPKEFESAFKVARERAGSVLVIQDIVTVTHIDQIVRLATASRLPAVYMEKEWAEAGGLMSYGVNQAELHRRAAIYVDKILKGAKPADLPVEQPTKFELVINLKTAKQIGLTIPPNVLARADRVIR